MKVALTIWQERISPVFDSAQMLLIADIQDSKVTKRRLEPFFPSRPKHLVDRLNELKVKVVICGAITEVPAIVIEAGGIELIPFIGGLTEEILGNYARGIAIIPKFLMPGCGHRGRRQKKKDRTFSGVQKEMKIMPGKDGTGPFGQGLGAGRSRGKGRSGKTEQRTCRGPGKGQDQNRGVGQGWRKRK